MSETTNPTTQIPKGNRSTDAVDPYLDPLEMADLVPGCMSQSHSYEASPVHQEKLGFPGELVDDWHDKAIDKMGELVGK